MIPLVYHYYNSFPAAMEVYFCQQYSLQSINEIAMISQIVYNAMIGKVWQVYYVAYHMIHDVLRKEWMLYGLHIFISRRMYTIMEGYDLIDGLPVSSMGLLPDTQNCGMCIRRECLERFPRHRLQRKRLVSDPGMHHDTCATHVAWCLSGSLTRGGGENVTDIPGACATRNFTYLVRGICKDNPIRWIMSQLNDKGHQGYRGNISQTVYEIIIQILFEKYKLLFWVKLITFRLLCR